MEYDEENISQEDLEKDKGAEEKDKEEIVEVANEPEPKETKEEMMPQKPRSAGLMLTIFGAVLVILIGGLASYYYYTFQQAGQSNERVLTNVWDETVLTSINLINKFEQIEDFAQLGDTSKDNFESYVGDANRTVRDGIFDVQSQTGLSPTAGTFGNKLYSFLDDYSSMLGELKRIAARADDIEDLNDLRELTNYSDDMESSYDDLILVGNSFIHANLSREIFDMPNDVVRLLEEKLESDGTLELQEKENRQAAETVATQFVQAWKDRDADAMSPFLT